MKIRHSLPLIRIDWVLLGVLLLSGAPATASVWLDCEVEARWLHGHPVESGDATLTALIHVTGSIKTDGSSGGKTCIEDGAQMIDLNANADWEGLAGNTPIRLRYHVYSALGPSGIIHREVWELIEVIGEPEHAE